MSGNFRTLEIRRGLKADLPILLDGEFGWCTDTLELFIGFNGTNTLLNDLSYDPATPGDWLSTPPDNIIDALDRIAAALAAEIGGPIP